MNQERINDRVKLLHHRLVARRLGADPRLVAHARAVLDRWRRSQPPASWMAEWDALLQLPVPALREALVRRTEAADRLRISSPFALVDAVSIKDVALRRRLWRVARRGASEPSRT